MSQSPDWASIRGPVSMPFDRFAFKWMASAAFANSWKWVANRVQHPP
jgi:hypothetical protein